MIFFHLFFRKKIKNPLPRLPEDIWPAEVAVQVADGSDVSDVRSSSR